MLSKSIPLFIILLLVGFFETAVGGENTEHSRPEFSYKHYDAPMVSVNQALQSAKDSNRLLIVALGASWCHDSGGLASRFSQEPLLPIIKDKYETIFIDVGFLEDRRLITSRFGQAHYFATPTVFIVDPETERTLNWATVKMWGAADSVSMEEYESYFTGIEDKAITKQPSSTSIADFASRQAERLQQGYEILGPKLKANVEGQTDDTFEDLWREVKGFRMTLQDDLIELYQASSDVKSGDFQSTLTFPEYGPFSWED